MRSSPLPLVVILKGLRSVAGDGHNITNFLIVDFFIFVLELRYNIHPLTTALEKQQLLKVLSDYKYVEEEVIAQLTC